MAGSANRTMVLPLVSEVARTLVEWGNLSKFTFLQLLPEVNPASLSLPLGCRQMLTHAVPRGYLPP